MTGSVFFPFSSSSALALQLSSRISDRPVMCTQDQWGTARWPLLPWQRNGEQEERERFLLLLLGWMFRLSRRHREYEKRAAGTRSENQRVLCCLSSCPVVSLFFYLFQCISHILVFRVRVSHLTHTLRPNSQWCCVFWDPRSNSVCVWGSTGCRLLLSCLDAVLD